MKVGYAAVHVRMATRPPKSASSALNGRKSDKVDEIYRHYAQNPFGLRKRQEMPELNKRLLCRFAGVQLVVIEAASCFIEMDITLREHIDRLKCRIDLLTREMMEDWRTQDERKRFEVEVGIACLALAHYEAALKQEHKVFPAQPSDSTEHDWGRPDVQR